ncbi:uncharacterized protein LOC119628345 [Bombyx mori]|uniref:Juvenile hormone binding protein n=1 Tax=Bombyx mori TaxID=7091 RepID=A0A8R2AFW6_BOMMO|nr:uncharacterized protein LOC119628345 [Bombyx mori]
MLTTLLLLSCAFFSASGEKEKCKITDKQCIVLFSNSVFEKIFEADNNQNIDPMYIEFVEGNFPDRKIKLTNISMTGYNTCKVFDLYWDIEQSLLNLEFYCLGFSINGQYEMSGLAVTVPTEEKGKFTIDTKSYKLMPNTTFELVQTVGNKTLFHLKDFNVKVSPLEKVALHFTNLYNGQEIPSAKFLAQEHWRNIIYTLQDKFASTCFKNVYVALNKVFTTMPLEEYFEL